MVYNMAAKMVDGGLVKQSQGENSRRKNLFLTNGPTNSLLTRSTLARYNTKRCLNDEAQENDTTKTEAAK
jgi:hypothetical protein